MFNQHKQFSVLMINERIYCYHRACKTPDKGISDARKNRN